MLKNFRFLTSGESHGQCLNAIIEGLPAGLKINLDFIDSELNRRQKGYGRSERMAIEVDKIEIKSGVRFGKTTGAPVCLEIKNKDFENWRKIMSTAEEDFTDEKSFNAPRPGHADFAGAIKYDLQDLRDVLERSSARKTAIDVAIGAIAKLILKEFDINCFSTIIHIAGENEEEKIKAKIDWAKVQGETLGGKFEIIFENIPVGLGSHVHWDRKLDGLLAQAVMSIPAIKSVETGLGEKSAEVSGSLMHDEIFFENTKYFRTTNRAGGIEGGISNGENIIIKASMKPLPTMKKPLVTIDFKDNSQVQSYFERSDVCAVEACCVVAEAMAACVLADEFLEKFGKDSISQIRKNYRR